MIKQINLPLKLVYFGILPFFLISCSALGNRTIDLGDWNQIKLERLLAAAGDISEPGQKIAFISSAFLETPYLANTLIGNAATAEKLVIRLDGVDCFTLLDYVEALRRSSTFSEFKEVLQRIRYREGHVNFLYRNHFFSEWGDGDFSQLYNVTTLVGRADILQMVKQLNQREDGSVYLPGYPVKRRNVTFISPEAVNESVLARLQSGDYVGIYNPMPGLDVSHTGIIIKKSGKVLLRHASSKQSLQKVTDEELLPYLGDEKGLIVYRPIDKR